MNKLSTERAIEVLHIVRSHYASLTLRYPKGKDCKGIDNVMCSEIANSCLVAIKALEQSCEDATSRAEALKAINNMDITEDMSVFEIKSHIGMEIATLPPVYTKPMTGRWIDADIERAMCSCCKRINYLYGTYCKHCGAKNG